MNQADLTERFDALQEKLMTLYESAPSTIDAQIEIWQIIRKENVYYYYGRKEGYKSFGLQPIPSLAVSEYKAKEAIQQVILLKSLKNSEFGKEEWTLTTTSAELTHTQPKNAFKKYPYTVDVHYDHKVENSFPYTNWDALYIQDENDKWYKTPGLVDINGLYFEDKHGVKNYFVIFATDAPTYGTTGEWTVYYKNQTISTSSASTSQASLFGSLQGPVRGIVTSSTSGDTIPEPQTPRRQKSEEGRVNSTTSTPPTLRQRRRRARNQQRESPTTSRSKRRRLEEDSAPVSPGEVGSRHTVVSGRNLTRLERLEAEARDPPILLVTGASNQLKCWRFRIKKAKLPCKCISTVFSWAGSRTDDCTKNHKMLIAFQSREQRELFIASVTFPKGTFYTYGSLNAL